MVQMCTEITGMKMLHYSCNSKRNEFRLTKGSERVEIQKNIIILNHGRFGEELIQSASLIIGDIDDIYAISLQKGMSIEDYYALVKEQLFALHGELLILTDLYGGTPCNVAMMMGRECTLHVVCGVNLPMLIELVMARNIPEKSVDELVDAAMNAALSSIMKPALMDHDF